MFTSCNYKQFIVGIVNVTLGIKCYSILSIVNGKNFHRTFIVNIISTCTVISAWKQKHNDWSSLDRKSSPQTVQNNSRSIGVWKVNMKKEKHWIFYLLFHNSKAVTASSFFLNKTCFSWFSHYSNLKLKYCLPWCFYSHNVESTYGDGKQIRTCKPTPWKA